MKYFFIYKLYHLFVCCCFFVFFSSSHQSYRSRHIYIYIYVCVCRKTDNNDPRGRNDLLTGQHYSVSVLLNHHQDHEG